MILPSGASTPATFGYDPALPMPLLATIGVACGIVTVAFFMMERRRAAKPRLLWLFFPLRLLALAGVWLALANPSSLHTVRDRFLKHVTLCIDTSASMNIRDPAAGSANAARWSQATGQAPAPSAELDEATALLSVAQPNLLATESAISLDVITPRLDAALRAVRQAMAQLETVRKRPAMSAPLDPLIAGLEAEVLRPLERMCQAAAPASGAQGSSRASLPSLLTRLRELREQIRAVADAQIPPSPSPAAPGEPSRIKLFQRWIARGEQGWLKELDHTVKLERVRFAKAVMPVETKLSQITADNPANPQAATDLQAALSALGRSAEDGRLDLAILVTDGGHNATDQPPRIPASLARVPLIVVPAGDYQPRRDINLRWTEAPKTLLLGDQLKVQARVAATLCQGESTVIQLLQGDVILDSKELHFNGKHADCFVDLQWAPGKTATYDLNVRVKPVAGEASFANNERPLRVSVVDDHIDLLVVDASPRWETRYLSNLFRREAQSHVTTLLFSPVHAFPGHKPPPQPALPLALEAWQRFQVVVLGDLSPLQLTEAHQRVLKTYVENGGCLVLIAGTDHMPAHFAGAPLEELLPVEAGGPVESSGYGVRLTPDGMADDSLRISGEPDADEAALWSSVYEALPIYDISEWSKPKPGARVLIEAQPRGASGGAPRVYLATQSYGRGTVAYLSSPSTYSLRWRYGDRLHYQFWGQFVRALVANQFGAGTPLVRMQADRFAFTSGEPVRVRLRLRSSDGAPVTHVSGQITAYQQDHPVGQAALQPNPRYPGDYEATLESLPEGRLDLRPDGPEIEALLNAFSADTPHVEVDVEAGGASQEMLPSAEPPPFFNLIKNAPNGLLVAPDTVPTVLMHLDLSPQVTEIVQRTPLWDRWAFLLAIVGLLVLEWIGRKICGLV